MLSPVLVFLLDSIIKFSLGKWRTGPENLLDSFKNVTKHFALILGLEYHIYLDFQKTAFEASH